MLLIGDAAKSKFYIGLAAWKTTRTMAKHYHLSLKLSGVKRWKQMKEEIVKSHNVVLIFLDRHENYHSAYKYICKSDTQVCHSKHHPNLKDVGSPVTKNPPRLYVQDAKKTNESVDGSSKPSCSKTKRLSNLGMLLNF